MVAAFLFACAGNSEPLGGGGASGGGRPSSGGLNGASGGRQGSGGSLPHEAGGTGGAPVSGGSAQRGGAAGRPATAAVGGGEPGEGGSSVDSGGSPGAAGLVLEAGNGGAPEGGAGAGGADTAPIEGEPCDIYAAADVPCVAAYSTVRALFEAYAGPLYQVRRADGLTRDIGVIATGSFADAALQDAFCEEEACTVSVIYDQSGQENHLTSAPAGCYLTTAEVPSNEADAKSRLLEVGGHSVYALQMIAHDGYRANQTSGMPTGGEAQGIYEVVDGKRFGEACCWDFGNGSTDNCPSSPGTSNALFFGVGYWGAGAGEGPWFMGDFENGVWAGGDGASSVVNPGLPSAAYDFAFGVLKTRSNSYTLRVANAQAGNLTTGYDGAAPNPFQMEGAVILGVSSDASDSSYGTFFEGAVTRGRPSDAVDAAVLRNVQAAGYGR